MSPGSCMLVHFPVAIKKIPDNSNLVKDGAISTHRIIRKSIVHPGGEDTVSRIRSGWPHCICTQEAEVNPGTQFFVFV